MPTTWLSQLVGGPGCRHADRCGHLVASAGAHLLESAPLPRASAGLGTEPSTGCGRGVLDEQIFSLTTFVALRVTFSTVNDSLGAQPDQELVDRAPGEIVRCLDELG